MSATKTHPACTIHEDGMRLHQSLDKKTKNKTKQQQHEQKEVTQGQISPKMVNPRDIAGNAEEEEEEEVDYVLSMGVIASFICRCYVSVSALPIF